jgi:hypothetical protein
MTTVSIHHFDTLRLLNKMIIIIIIIIILSVMALLGLCSRNLS